MIALIMLTLHNVGFHDQAVALGDQLVKFQHSLEGFLSEAYTTITSSSGMNLILETTR